MGVAIIISLLSFNSVVFTAFALKIVSGISQHQPVIPQTPLAFETDIPSVTVCIPARNEEHALAECLQRVINSTYERLEIIVLDDSSSDGTSLLIKSFAHAGVRFVRGAALPDGWLGKNHALLELIEQANGSYVLFLDVDTRLSPGAIEYMVRSMLSKGVDMVSALPRREDYPRASVVMSPLRYFWELARSRSSDPATASSAWMVSRSVASRMFKDHEAQIKDAIMPEAFIASRLGNDYAYLVGTKQLGVAYEKKWSSQVDTSIRLLYPMLGSSVGVSLIAAATLALMLAPYGVLAIWIWQPFSPLYIWAIGLVIAFSTLYTYYAKTFWARSWQWAPLVWPLIVIQELILILTSTILYSRGRVLWKGRPVRSRKATS